ncbi:hypothetical protein K402DRAFT_385746 [Aulographum hederae CBS 113979]|uniref:THO complex subunit 2 n=1 Tax=Aulographum hederae CBS 113979 TaxID=1176131 RepID=A0A6G1GM00_9PEZI|nr:hypothetical protein K402DRAFT_385746 [Aulographum hederae CBS 113979]
MAPAQKRKRGDRTYSHNDSPNRPSPHRPQDLPLSRGAFSQFRSGRGRGAMDPPGAPSPAPLPAAISRPLTPASADPTPAPPVDLPPYAYQLITDKRLASWKEAGMKEAVSEAIAGGEDTLYDLLHELATATIRGRLNGDDAGRTFTNIIEQIDSPNVNIDMASMFMNCMGIFSDGDPEDTAIFTGQRLRPMAMATGLSPQSMRAQLDPSFLAGLGLVKKIFRKQWIKHVTNVQYRMSNYNLLQEEPEGYAKLMTELFTVVFSEDTRADEMPQVFEQIKSLIGAFDLDAGRALDVILDVFANLLVKYNEFFLKLLRTSSWWSNPVEFPDAQWDDATVQNLPQWALPNFPRWKSKLTEEEVQDLAQRKVARDAWFWDRVRQIGARAFWEIGVDRVVVDKHSYQASADQKESKLKDDMATYEQWKVARQNKRKDEKLEAEFNSRKKHIAQLRWIADSGLRPTNANSMAAQFLGFKLRYYASDARESHERLPDNLIHLAALLIKVGFIAIEDLWPHLYPAEADMEAVRAKLAEAKLEKERKSRPGASENALSRAGALVDDTVPAPRSRVRDADAGKSTPRSDAAGESIEPPKIEAPVRDPLPEPKDQKHALLSSLLLHGAVPQALFILGKHHWMVDLHPDITQHIIRLIHHSLSKVYDQVAPLPDVENIQEVTVPDETQVGIPKPHVKWTALEPRRTVRWTNAEKCDPTDEKDYKFYWEEWADNVPVCQTVDDVFSLCDTLVTQVGTRIGQDATLLSKFARIGKQSITDDPSQATINRWADLSKSLLVPALSHSDVNSGVAEDVWELIKDFSIGTRFTIYGEWFHGQTSRLPEMRACHDQANYQARSVLKRITKSNTKTMARTVSKTSNASPAVFHMQMLKQIQSYDNLIDSVVETLRYISSLSYDVLVWAILTTLGGTGRDQTASDGMAISPWLNALSRFIGRVFKRYAQLMSPNPVLRYVADLLHNGSSKALIVLEQIVYCMSGIKSDMAMSPAQLDGMVGGPVLQGIMFQQIGDMRNDKKLQSASKRMVRSLIQCGLAQQFLILLARERQLFLDRPSEANAPLKVSSTRLDAIHDTFAQYLEMIRRNVSIEDFDAAIPDLVDLIAQFGVDPSFAFWICRPSLKRALDDAEKASAPRKAITSVDASGDTEMGGTGANGAGETNGVPSTGVPDLSTGNAMDVVSPTDISASHQDGSTTPENAEDAVNAVFRALVARLETALPDKFETISVSFYFTFWQLSVQELAHLDGYKAEHTKLITEIKSLAENSDKLKRIRNHDRNAVRALGQKEDDAKELSESVVTEQKAVVTEVSKTLARMKKEKNHWFTNFLGYNAEGVHGFVLQECFLPRMKLSPLDAVFASKMLFRMHKLNPPGFRTMLLIDRFMGTKLLSDLIFMTTLHEAQNVGHFLFEILKALEAWRTSEADYTLAAFGKNRELFGFAAKMNPDGSIQSLLEHADFRRVLFKWHGCLFQALRKCLKSGNYMGMRNSIAIIDVLRGQFPRVDIMGNQLLADLKTVSEKETRQDLQLLAGSIKGSLKGPYLKANQFRPDGGSSRDCDTNVQDDTLNAEVLKAAASQANQADREAKKVVSSTAPATPAAHSTASPRPVTTVTATAPAARESQTARAAQAATSSSLNANVTASGGNTTNMATQDPSGSGSALNTSNRPPPTNRNDGSEDGETVEGPVPATTVTAVPTIPPTTQSQTRNATPAQASLPAQPQTGASANSRLPPPSLPNRPDTGPPSQGRGRGRMAPHHRADERADFGRSDRPLESGRDVHDGRHRAPDGRTRRRSQSPQAHHADRERREQNFRVSRDYHHDRDPPSSHLPRDSRRGPGNLGYQPDRQQGPQGHVQQPSSDSRNFSQGTPRPLPSDGRNGPSDTSNTAPINPERAARIHGDIGHGSSQQERHPPPVDRPNHTQRSERDTSRRTDEHNDRDGRGSRPSRVQSPRTADVSTTVHSRTDERRDGHSSASHRPESGYATNQRDEPGPHAPVGPRADRPTRPGHQDGLAGARHRDVFQDQNAPPRAQVDPNFGRLNQDFTPSIPRNDPSYGRLNAAEALVPSGPRGLMPPSRNARGFSGPNTPAGNLPPPSGPASQRDANRQDSSFDRHAPQTSTPSTPATENAPPIHPTRLAQLDTNLSASTGSNSPGGAPSGPRGRARNVSAPVTHNPPPTGPASGAGRRQMSAVQNIVQSNQPPPFDRNNHSLSNNNPNVNIRGTAGSRSGGRGQQLLPPASPIDSPVPSSSAAAARARDEHPANRQDPMARRDVIGPMTTPAPDSRPNSRTDRNDRRRDGSERDRGRDGDVGSNRRERSPPRSSSQGMMGDDLLTRSAPRDSRRGPDMAPPNDNYGARSQRESGDRDRDGGRMGRGGRAPLPPQEQQFGGEHHPWAASQAYENRNGDNGRLRSSGGRNDRDGNRGDRRNEPRDGGRNDGPRPEKRRRDTEDGGPSGYGGSGQDNKRRRA